MGFLFFCVVILSLFIWGQFPSPPSWQRVGAGQQIWGWCVNMDLSGAVLLQARPTQPSVGSHKPLLLLSMLRRREGKDKNEEEETEKDNTGIPCFDRLRMKKQ